MERLLERLWDTLLDWIDNAEFGVVLWLETHWVGQHPKASIGLGAAATAVIVLFVVTLRSH